MGYRKLLIRIFTFLGGIYFFLEFVLPKKIGDWQFSLYDEQITDGFMLVSLMALGLGIINIFFVHGSKVIYRRSGWFNSVALLLGLNLMLFVSGKEWAASDQISQEVSYVHLLKDFSGQIASDVKDARPDVPEYSFRNQKLKEASETTLQKFDKLGQENSADAGYADVERLHKYQEELRAQSTKVRGLLNSLKVEGGPTPEALETNSAVSVSLGEYAALCYAILDFRFQFSTVKRSYSLLYDGLYSALGSAMFALLGFYIASAAYRAFRLKSVESGLMMGAALLVMLGQIPFGMWIWEGLPEVRLWLLENPNTAAFRAIKIGASIAALIMAVRMWLSIESESFSERQP